MRVRFVMNKSETVAKGIVENLVPGTRMHYCKSQSSGEHDFDIEYPGGARVPLEVTEFTDQGAEATRAAILESRRGGPFVRRVHCARDWYVHPMANANINKIRTHVDRYLAAIEAEGREQFFAFSDATESPAVSAILQELGIEAGNVSKWKSPSIGIAVPGDGGLVDPALVNKAVETEAWKTDNRRKLSSADSPEKHLFVYVAWTKQVVYVAVRDGVPPTSGPKLPPEITDVWVATWAGDRDGVWHSVWRVRNGFPWTHMGQVNIKTGERRASTSRLNPT